MVHQGKMILIAIGVAYLTFWLLVYFTNPIMLVPGFLLDRSLRTLFQLIGLGIQLGFISILWILVWSGLGWVRYIFGVFLVMGGLFNVILSIMIGSGGGVELVLGAMSLISGAALMISLSVEKFIEDRRTKGPPGLEIGLIIGGLALVLVGVVSVQVLQTWLLVQDNERETAFAGDVFKRLIPKLEVDVLDPVASEELKRQVVNSDYAGQLNELKQELGTFQDWPGLKAASLESLVIDHRSAQGDKAVFHTLVHFEKGDLMLELYIDLSKQPWEVYDIYCEKLPKQKADY